MASGPLPTIHLAGIPATVSTVWNSLILRVDFACVYRDSRVVLPVLLLLGVCVSYLFYLLPGVETRERSVGGFGGPLEKALHRRDTNY
jgi:hypothetical protein